MSRTEATFDLKAPPIIAKDEYGRSFLFNAWAQCVAYFILATNQHDSIKALPPKLLAKWSHAFVLSGGKMIAKERTHEQVKAQTLIFLHDKGLKFTPEQVSDILASLSEVELASPAASK